MTFGRKNAVAEGEGSKPSPSAILIVVKQFFLVYIGRQDKLSAGLEGNRQCTWSDVGANHWADLGEDELNRREAPPAGFH